MLQGSRNVSTLPSQVNPVVRARAQPNSTFHAETMHTIKMIWLLLAASPVLTRCQAEGRKINIREKLLEEMLSSERSDGIESPLYTQTDELGFIETLLQGDRYDDKSYSEEPLLRHRKHERFEYSKRGPSTIIVRPSIECCPSVTEKISPLGGLSRKGELLQLYRDSKTVQRFYQTKCLSGIVGRPCQFIESRLRHSSKCIQKYTYTYAIVKDLNITQPYRVDYIKVKSGCSCQLLV